jgi:hypothetical protein
MRKVRFLRHHRMQHLQYESIIGGMAFEKTLCNGIHIYRPLALRRDIDRMRFMFSIADS